MIKIKHSQTGITLKVHTNHDGVSASAIVLRSIAASSSRRFAVVAVKEASEFTSATLGVDDKELSLIFLLMR